MTSSTPRPQAYDIAATYWVAGAVTLIAISSAVRSFLETFTPDGVRTTLLLPINDATVHLTDPDATLAGSATTLSVLATDVNTVSQISLGAAIVVQAALWIGAAFVMVIFVRELSDRTPFSARAGRAITWGSYGTIAGVVVLMMLDKFGQNGVVAALSPDASTENGFAGMLPYVGWWAYAFALGVWSLSFRRGIALEKDAEGLV